MLNLPQPSFMPCTTCGASVAREERGTHECDEERRLDYQVHQLREEIEAFGSSFAAFLETPQGRFAAWDAEQRRPPLQES
jgi:hypothetical protein